MMDCTDTQSPKSLRCSMNGVERSHERSINGLGHTIGNSTQIVKFVVNYKGVHIAVYVLRGF